MSGFAGVLKRARLVARNSAWALAEQVLGNLLPFCLQRFLADWLSRSAVPIGGVGVISSFAVEVGMNPGAIAAFVLLGGLMGAGPVAFGVPPEAGEGLG